MIPIQELLFSIDTKSNSLGNLKGKFIPDETKIEVLNIVQLKLILKKLGINNSHQTGTDSFNKRYEDLQILQVPFEKHAVTSTGDLLNSYSLPLSSLSKEMIVPISAYVTANKGNCKNRMMTITEMMKHADIQFKLLSPHYTPLFEYQETLGSISSDIIYVYGKPDFTIDYLYFSYLRYPVQMDVAGYTHLDGTASTDENCELDYYMMDELVNLAVEEIADATGNQNQSQLSRARVKEQE